MTKRRLLITSGLPYANGDIHLGHMVETVQTDIFARAMRMMGHEVLYVCGDDTHGTPVEISATKRGIAPEELVAEAYANHTRDFAGFGIGFDNYYTTHSDENRELAYEIFGKLRDSGFVRVERIKQLYSEDLKRFLPDRYVKGKCPCCGAEDQYGDVCEVCKNRYDAIDLVEPRCVLDGSVPVVGESEHLFITLKDLGDFLRGFASSGVISDEVRNFVTTWIDEGLKDWDIARDRPYFGFEIPGHPGKFFYVWMDAPIGYMASAWAWCKQNGRDFRSYWNDPSTEIYHFIGKDIIYFHTLFWPAMLKVAGFKLPSRIHAHGFLTVNGQKMSKSRGTFILASKYLECLPAAYLRFYFAAKLAQGVEDIDLNIEDFYFRVRSGLVDNLANLHNRSFSFAETKLGGQLSDECYDDDCRGLISRARARVLDACRAYEEINLAAAVRAVCEIGNDANLFYQEKAPWSHLKGESPNPERARAIVTACAEVVRLIAIAIKPVVPDFAAKIFAQLNLPDQNLSDLEHGLGAGNSISNVKKTYIRPERAEFDALTANGSIAMEDSANKTEVKTTDSQTAGTVLPGEESVKEAEEKAVVRTPLKELIDFADFEKLDIRVGKVISCERVKKSNKLLCSQIEIGHPDGPVQILSGIAKHYEPESMVGRNVLVVTNLKPREMFGLKSCGMILAASDDTGLELPGVSLVMPGSGVH